MITVEIIRQFAKESDLRVGDVVDVAAYGADQRPIRSYEATIEAVHEDTLTVRHNIFKWTESFQWKEILMCKVSIKKKGGN